MNIRMEDEKNKIERGTLYLVATPIGNMSDITLRALKALEGCDFVAAEDTRNTGKLLAYYDIRRPLVSYHEHNKNTSGGKIISRLKAGESCALVTDAGMPGISDPGSEMVRLCIANGLSYTVLPGACAAVSGLILSGMESDSFTFIGFLDGSGNVRKEKLELLSKERRTLVFYEAPHRLIDTLKIMDSIFPDRKIALCREITKLNEEIIRSTVSEALLRCLEVEPRGEYVIVLEGNKEENIFWGDMTAAEHVEFYISQGMGKMEAIKAVSRDRACPKSEIYKEMI